MTKQELSSLLKSLGVPVNEGITSDKNTNECSCTVKKQANENKR